jgi:DNA-binding transcriptional regulator YiaG
MQDAALYAYALGFNAVFVLCKCVFCIVIIKQHPDKEGAKAMADAISGRSFLMTEHKVVFNGRITPDFGQLIRSKRKSLGISQREMGRILGICWTTLHKWERGHISCCQQRHIEAISDFMNGAYDAVIAAEKAAQLPEQCPVERPMLLYVQTLDKRLLISLPAAMSGSCAEAFQGVFDYIDEQVTAVHKAAAEASKARTGKESRKGETAGKGSREGETFGEESREGEAAGKESREGGEL